MRCARDDGELVLAAQQLRRLLVEAENLPVGAADDQHGGSLDLRQPRGGEVRSSPSGNHRADAPAELGGGAERGGGTRRGAEVPEGKSVKARLRLRPSG